MAKKSSYVVEFWDCGQGPVPGHRHKTELAAQRCAARYGGSTKKAIAAERGRKKRNLLNKRRAKALELYSQGRSKRSIAKELGIHFTTLQNDLLHKEREQQRALYDHEMSLRRSLQDLAKGLGFKLKGDQIIRAISALSRKKRLGITLNDAALMSGASGGESDQCFSILLREIADRGAQSWSTNRADSLSAGSEFQINKVRFKFLPENIGRALNSHYGPPEKFGEGERGERYLVDHALEDLRDCTDTKDTPVPGLGADGLLWLRTFYK